MHISLEKAKNLASRDGADVTKIEQLVLDMKLSKTAQIILFWTSTGRVSEKHIAEEFGWRRENVRSNVNKCLTDPLKIHFDISHNLGITGLRVFLVEMGYFVEQNDDNLTNILLARHSENSQVEKPDISSEATRLSEKSD